MRLHGPTFLGTALDLDRLQESIALEVTLRLHDAVQTPVLPSTPLSQNQSQQGSRRRLDIYEYVAISGVAGLSSLGSDQRDQPAIEVVQAPKGNRTLTSTMARSQATITSLVHKAKENIERPDRPSACSGTPLDFPVRPFYRGGSSQCRSGHSVAGQRLQMAPLLSPPSRKRACIYGFEDRYLIHWAIGG